MIAKPVALPSDLASALVALRAERDVAQMLAASAQAKLSAREALIAHLQLLIAKLKREKYGQRSEHTARLIDQLELELEELVVAASEDELAASVAAAKVENVRAFSTVQKNFWRWRDDGLLRSISNELVMAAREKDGREASPTAGVIDSQSVKTTESGGIRDFDAGKKVMGRKRHIVVDTLGLLVGLVIHAADIQDRDGAPAVLKSILKRWPWLRHVFADGGYAGPKLKGALQKVGKFTLEIIKRTDKAKGFEVLPRRWVVERTFAWLGRCRRLAKDFERTIASAEAWVFIANIRLLTRRLARH